MKIIIKLEKIVIKKFTYFFLNIFLNIIIFVTFIKNNSYIPKKYTLIYEYECYIMNLCYMKLRITENKIIYINKIILKINRIILF